MNEILRRGLGNYQTTLTGTALAASVYGSNVGLSFPNNQNEWISFIIALLIQILALLAKDAVQGAPPK